MRDQRQLVLNRGGGLHVRRNDDDARQGTVGPPAVDVGDEALQKSLRETRYDVSVNVWTSACRVTVDRGARGASQPEMYRRAVPLGNGYFGCRMSSPMFETP